MGGGPTEPDGAPDVLGAPAAFGATPAERRFRALYERNVEGIFSFFASRLGGHDGAADDLTADVFTVAWRRIGAVPAPPGDRVYLYRIAYRRMKNERRRRGRRTRLMRRLAAEPVAADAGGLAASSDCGEAGAPGGGDRGERVRSAIARLPVAQRDAIELVLWDGLSHAEAAELLGCTPNAVALRIHKARQRLRAELGADAAPAPEQHRGAPCRDGS